MPGYHQESSDSAVNAGPNPATLRLFRDPAFVAPSYCDVRIITPRHELTGSAVARIMGVTPRTVRKWLAPPNAQNHSPIPYAAWRLLLIEMGIVEPQNVAVPNRDV